MCPNVKRLKGPLIIRVGFWCQLYYMYNCIINEEPQKGMGNYSDPYDTHPAPKNSAAAG